MRYSRCVSNVPVNLDVLQASTLQRYYQDNPGAQGSGTYAQSFPVTPLLPYPALRLSQLSVRWDFPFAAGEQATIRLYIYRKASEFGAFNLIQATDPFVADNTRGWSWTHQVSNLIRVGPVFNLNPETDSIAVSNVYVSGPSPTARALRVCFSMIPDDAPVAIPFGAPEPDVWPPPP